MYRIVLFPISSGMKKLADLLESHGAEGYIPVSNCHIQTIDGPGAIVFVLGDTAERSVVEASATVEPEIIDKPQTEDHPADKPE
jgi:hypothetical protein